LSTETTSTPEDHDIHSLTLDELREEADRLLTLYHSTKEPDEMLDLSTRYTKIDMLIDDHKAPSKATSEMPDEVEVNEEVIPDPKPHLDDTVPLPDEPKTDDSQLGDTHEAPSVKETAPEIEDPFASVPDIAENKKTVPVAADTEDDEDIEEIQAVESATPKNSVVDAFPDIEQDVLTPQDEGAPSPESAVENSFDADYGEVFSDSPVTRSPDEPAGPDTVDAGQTDNVAVDQISESGSEHDSADSDSPEELIENTSEETSGDSPGKSATNDIGDNLGAMPSLDLESESHEETTKSPLEEDTLDTAQESNEESAEESFSAPSPFGFESGNPEEITESIEIREEETDEILEKTDASVTDDQADDDTSPLPEDLSHTPDDAQPQVEDSSSVEIHAESEVESEVEAEVEAAPPPGDFEDALASLTAALDNPPVPDDHEETTEAPQPDITPTTVDEDDTPQPSSSESPVFNTVDDLMDELNIIKPDPDDALFDIDSTPEEDEQNTASPDQNIIDIIVDDETNDDVPANPETVSVPIDIDNDENIVDGETTAKFPETVLDPVEVDENETTVDSNPVFELSGENSDDKPVEEKPTSFGGLDDVPLPSITPLSESANQDLDPAATIPAIPSFQDLSDHEISDETVIQSPARSSQDTIPMSAGEELPKLELTETQRICAKCGQVTSLKEETCDSCSYADASLGILNAIVARDTQQTSRLLNAKPAIIHTITSKHAWTLLHMAASGGNARLVDLLLRSGSQVNPQNIYGKTALHYASLKGHVQIVALLLEKNADLSILFEGKTALEHASENNQHEVVELLKTKGS